MTKDNIYLHTISIDSLKFRIPLNLLNSVHSVVKDVHFEGNATTGEIDETSFKLKAKDFYISDSVKVRALIQKRATALNHNEECLIIYLNSKILGSRYFEGLTANNIELVFNKLTEIGLLDCSFDVFLDSECTDIDLKLDDSMTLYEWKILLSQFRKMSINQERYKTFNPKKENPLNIGLQFSQRTTRSYNKPFFKLYHKGGELIHNSTDFKNEFFNDIDNENLTSIVRIETTIKDKKHAKLLGIEKTTLQSLLLLKDEQKFSVFRKIFEKHLQPMKVHSIKPRTNQPNEILLFNAIAYLIEVNGFSINEVTRILLHGIECRKIKSRKKSEILSVYEKHIQGSDIDVSVTKVKQFFDRFEWC
jgi:hypothetical protein